MFCKECGRKIEDNSNFCRFCGFEISQAQYEDEYYANRNYENSDSNYENNYSNEVYENAPAEDANKIVTKGNLFLYLMILPCLFESIFLTYITTPVGIIGAIVSYAISIICVLNDFTCLRKLNADGAWKYIALISPLIYTFVRREKLKQYNAVGPFIFYILMTIVNVAVMTVF